ncbi:MAG: hypothetical protein J6S21_02485 [Victivallales bacterium]|nr:hypothetical protein [Victivallales bacterium]
MTGIWKSAALPAVLCLYAVVCAAEGPLLPVSGEINHIISLQAGRGRECIRTFELREGMNLEIIWLGLPKRCPVKVTLPDGRVLSSSKDPEFVKLMQENGAENEYSRALRPVLFMALKGKAALSGRYQVTVGPAVLWGRISGSMVVAAEKREAVTTNADLKL